MYKHILVAITNPESDSATFATALKLARPAGAHLEFLHVKVDVAKTVMMISAGGFGAAAMTQDVLDQTETEIETRRRESWDRYNAFCTAESITTKSDTGKSDTGKPDTDNSTAADPPASPAGGVTAEMATETGTDADWLAAYGQAADLTVVSRAVGLEAMEAALMDSGRPLLIVPAEAPDVLPGTVAIAWKDTPEAARAVAAAMPLIEQAKRVIILSVSEDGTAQTAGCARQHRSLLWRNPNTELRHVARDGQAPAAALLAEAANLGASLLVMGGYSHSRLRQAVFGGFTRQVLSEADITVLMAH